MAVIVSDGARIYHSDFNLGTVRLAETLHLSRSPTLAARECCEEFLAHMFNGVILPELKPLLPPKTAGFTLVGTGGTATSLAVIKARTRRLPRTDQRNQWLTRSEVSEMADRLWELSPEERRHLPGLSSARLDVMLPGVAIVEAAMKHLGFSQMRISRRGVRYGALLCANEAPRTDLWPGSLSYLGNYSRSLQQMVRARVM